RKKPANFDLADQRAAATLPDHDWTTERSGNDAVHSVHKAQGADRVCVVHPPPEGLTAAHIPEYYRAILRTGHDHGPIGTETCRGDWPLVSNRQNDLRGLRQGHCGEEEQEDCRECAGKSHRMLLRRL